MDSILLQFLCIFIAINAYSHPGGLDASGCHTNRKTLEYHCHQSKLNFPKNQIQPSDSQAAEIQKLKSQLQALKQQLNNHAVPNQNNNHEFSCGSKSRCNEMSSCAEAKYYLNQCGLYRLDRDSDGVPCESICN